MNKYLAVREVDRYDDMKFNFFQKRKEGSELSDPVLIVTDLQIIDRQERM